MKAKTGANKLISIMLVTAVTFGLFAAVQLTAYAVNIGPRTSAYDDPANGIYVSPSGNDATANGSVDKPYKSINTALGAAPAGSTIILRGGTYKEGINVRVRKPNITIKSKKGEWAVIDLTAYNSGHNEDSGVYFDVDSSGGKMQSVEVMGGYYAVCMETKWNWGGSDDHVAASNIIIEDCKIHDSRYDTVKVKPNCKNITIRYNEIYNSGRAYNGTPSANNGEGNAEGIDNVNGNNMKVQNNYIHDIVGNGIYAKGGATDCMIENNRIERANGAGIMAGFDTSPDFFDLKVNPQYYENIRGVVRNNLIIDAGWEGIGLYGSKDAQIYNNTIVNAVKGGLYHSAVYFGLTYQDWDSKAGRPANINSGIHHNVVSQPASFSRQMIEIRYSGDLGGMSALSGKPTMNDNCYYIVGKSAAFTDNRTGNILSGAGLSAWKTHIGGESGTLEVNPSLGADYMTTNPQCAGMGIQYPLTVIPGTIPPNPTVYTLTVSGGTGGGSYTAGQTVNIMVNAAQPNKIFDKWTTSNGGSFGNASSVNTTFTMPSGAVTVTANWKDAPVTSISPATSTPDNTSPPPITTYTVTVNGGTGGGRYAAGAKVNVTAAAAPAGQAFDIWATSDGVSFSNAANSSTSFVMPSNTVTVTATYKDLPAGYYAVNVLADIGGTANANVTSAKQGDIVNLTAEEGEGYIFKGWQIESGVTVISGDRFTMPGNTVTIKAVFELIPGVTEPVETTDSGATTVPVPGNSGGFNRLWILFAVLSVTAVGGGIAFIIMRKKKENIRD